MLFATADRRNSFYALPLIGRFERLVLLQNVLLISVFRPLSVLVSSYRKKWALLQQEIGVVEHSMVIWNWNFWSNSLLQVLPDATFTTLHLARKPWPTRSNWCCVVWKKNIFHSVSLETLISILTLSRHAVQPSDWSWPDVAFRSILFTSRPQQSISRWEQQNQNPIVRTHFLSLLSLFLGRFWTSLERVNQPATHFTSSYFLCGLYLWKNCVLRVISNKWRCFLQNSKWTLVELGQMERSSGFCDS